ncbi:MAG: DUF3343 domain-containing protein [Tissierellia bacterium]|nr:DUF3343 domain-containing protein [Tissierellia bacterium]
MKDKEYGIITFKSTHFAIKAESVFGSQSINTRTIPVPREISRSCGLAIRFDLDDMEKVDQIISEFNLDIDGIYKVIKGDNLNKVEKLN